METNKYLNAIAYYYAMGHLDQIDQDADGNFEVASDFAHKYSDDVGNNMFNASKSTFTAWELYVKQLREFVVVDLGIAPADDDETVRFVR